MHAKRTRFLSPQVVGLFCLAMLGGMSGARGATNPPSGRIDFDRDVRPILSENCFACHGFDANKRQAGLRLDVPEIALHRLPSGQTAIVPSNPAASELVARITTNTPLHMPPVDSGKKLTAAQIAILRRWIQAGAHYAQHWAFVPPKRPPLPAVKQKAWPQNPVDRFILARLEQAGLTPSPEADRRTLIRRVTLDLTGLPPIPAEVDAFLADHKPGAYERVVDRLLQSPHYGERMALNWLDLARYADTHGYHIDSQREMWRWRDWVIDAYNHNMPYDRFVIEQLAGDLLPNATLSQKIATGFNRNHPITFEGGAIPEEYQAAYVFDRVDTTATAFMGLTMRCAQCHDHKYDPITQKEFYRFYAFFNTIPEQGLDGQKGNAAPFIKAPTSDQDRQMAGFTVRIADLEKQAKARADSAAPAVVAWIQTDAKTQSQAPSLATGLVAHYALDETGGMQVRDLTGKQPSGTVHGKATWASGKIGGALKLDGTTYVDLGSDLAFERTDSFSYGAWVYPTSNDAMTVVSRMDDGADFRGWDMYLGDGKVYVHLIHKWEENAIRVNTKMPIALNRWTHLFATYDGSGKAKGITIYVDGKPADLDITHDKLTGTIRTDKPALIGRRTMSAPFQGMLDEVRIYGRAVSGAEVAQLYGGDSIRQALDTPEDKRTSDQKEALTRAYLEKNDPAYVQLAGDLADQKKKRDDLDNAIPTTMVMQEMDKPRETFLLVRGQYDHPGEKVTPGTPAILPPLPQGVPANRLALACWLVDPRHPLTARVAVNRYWQMLFGAGLVRTAENFGTQGERPTHPELLDWLAAEFIRTGWNTKAMLRLLVTSATYRQSARVTPHTLEKDPENRLLARAPRLRLPAEFVRDQALAAGGLLVATIGGPSVKPYQPAGLWEELAFGSGFSAQSYTQDHGMALYRRSMYTFWKRTCPPPSLQTFDAPEREFCIVRRSATDTPLQALVLMNDPTYVEASRKFAERILLEGGKTPAQRLVFAYRTLLARPPTPAEVKVLSGILQRERAVYRKDPAAAMKLMSVGEAKRNETLDAAEVAAWSAIASILFNTDEAITKS